MFWKEFFILIISLNGILIKKSNRLSICIRSYTIEKLYIKLYKK